MQKRLLSVILSMSLVLSEVPTAALAEAIDDTSAEEVPQLVVEDNELTTDETPEDVVGSEVTPEVTPEEVLPEEPPAEELTEELPSEELPVEEPQEEPEAVVEESTIVAGEGYTLGNTLVDDAATDFSQTVDVGFAGTVVATFDGIAEKTFDAVAVVLIVLGCIDAALGSDGVCTAGGILNAEYVDIEAHGTQRSGSRGTGKACTHNNDVDFTLVGRVYKFLTGFVVGPFFGEGTFGYFGI